ncbi:hypothetical protein KIN20_021045 [Parelaphostrongylus tenuis]|uniref:Uncharacterized protein n=1 Tax=Parelaphostrongylus tenuis TaxID=148309 RepID=A0AAD5QTX4_PARTN|nr:hypothetical protein KIN20_021045 [Parelaphostrongylus tenuis]
MEIMLGLALSVKSSYPGIRALKGRLPQQFLQYAIIALPVSRLSNVHVDPLTRVLDRVYPESLPNLFSARGLIYCPSVPAVLISFVSDPPLLIRGDGLTKRRSQ